MTRYERFRLRASLAVCAGGGVASLGCEAAVATYPHCPVPVLISDVNRVGVKTPVPVRKTGRYDVLNASSGVLAEGTSSTTTSGNTQTTTTTGHRESAGPPALTFEVLGMLPNQAEMDVSDIALSELWVGNYMVVLPGYFLNSVWIDPKGRKVWRK